jgi:hypothetical protein
MYAHIMLANKDVYLKILKQTIKEVKDNKAGLKFENSCKAQYFCWIRGFVSLNNVLVYSAFKTLEETKIVSCPMRMFHDICRCHVLDTQHAGRVSTEAKVKCCTYF